MEQKHESRYTYGAPLGVDGELCGAFLRQNEAVALASAAAIRSESDRQSGGVSVVYELVPVKIVRASTVIVEVV